MKMTNYLDIQKSIMISSPAGSGKTEKLARRYISLLKSGVDVERILAITFTDKAAAEMKQRILRILQEEDEALFQELLRKIPLMRVSTIHSFCGTLIRRFSFEASVDPNYTVEDAIDASILWEEILYGVLMEAAGESGGENALLQSLSERGFRGLEHLKEVINTLYARTPFSLEAKTPVLPSENALDQVSFELKSWPGAREAIHGYEELFERDTFQRLAGLENQFLTKNRTPRLRAPAGLKGMTDYKSWASRMFQFWLNKNIGEYLRRTERLQGVFERCYRRYSLKKLEKGTLDFSDLEYTAYKLLTENPEWANVLYAFDEKTDHILVDEFQDTNMFQWAVIDKLTEEWRSGLGAKRGEGLRPTIFLVGDEKQSIYLFRGANVGIFHGAKEKLHRWLNDEFSFEEVRENYRSLPAIIDFTNTVFSALMKNEEGMPSWVTEYSPFTACRKDAHRTGKVELILLDDNEESAAELRKREAVVIAKRMRSLAGDFPMWERNLRSSEESIQTRPCRYMDMVLLLRKRTHLKTYEETFREWGIPFVVVKGIGFYQEPEVAILRALIYFLVNPRDSYSLYVLLKSPLFRLDENVILKITETEGEDLLSKMRTSGKTVDAVKRLDGWLSSAAFTPIAELVEKILVETRAWGYFYEPQRKANVKKFIQLIEGLEANGKSLIKIKDFLERTSNRADEPKANVNTEGMNAVRIMTIHGAKGLEFPLVFLPGLDERFTDRSDNCLVYDKEGKLFFKYLPEAWLRMHDRDFQLHLMKEAEELKRLFYVAVTRAEEGLFLTGKWTQQKRSFLGFLQQGLGVQKTDRGFRVSLEEGRNIQGLSILSEQDVDGLTGSKSAPKPLPSLPPIPAVIPISVDKPLKVKTVSGTADIQRRHGEDWIVLGEVFHHILEGVSKEKIREDEITGRAERLFAARLVPREKRKKLVATIERDTALLKESGIWEEIILPREDSFSELPFILHTGDTVYSGRIDRILCTKDVYAVYDYKTFPVDDREIEYLLRGYSSQLDIYRRAVRELFHPKEVRSYIVFTHRGEKREIA